MKNREALFPNRIKFTDEETGKQYVGTWDYADSPTEVGTKLTADVFLSNDNAAEYGIESEDPTPNEVFTALSQHASRHASNGADPIAPADIGAASLDGNGKVTAEQACSRVINIDADTTISATHLGSTLKVNGGYTITIPYLSSIPVGSEIEIYNHGSDNGCTITAEGNTYFAFDGYNTKGKTLILRKYGVCSLKKMTGMTWKVAGEVE